MKSFIFSLGLAAMVQAQGFDFAAVDAAPEVATNTPPIGAGATTVEYNSATAIASAAAEITASPVTNPAATATPVEKRLVKTRLPAEKRGTCATQPVGYGPVPTPDTAAAFVVDTDFSTAATGMTTPSGWTQTFQNLNGSNSAYAYMGYTALTSYDASTCAAKCKKISGCNAFNIYFERDPSLDPGSDCLDPPSTTVIKCVFWGGPVYSTNANNVGQWRNNFHVVIAGSNGYNTAGPFAAPKGYTSTDLGKTAINAPLDCNKKDTYMGVKIFTSGPFDPSLCAAACSAQSDYNRAHPASDGSVQTCQFYNTYMLIKNGGSGQQICALYSAAWDSSYAKNDGQWRGTDHYTIEFSVTGTNSTADGVTTCA